MKGGWKLLAAACVLVFGTYAYMAQSGVLELLCRNAADTYYNLLVQGFRTGQLNLKKDVPPGLAALADPYDPAANAPYSGRPHRTLDLSYYKGKFYLYFGVTPALILFWPFVALTGHYLFHRQAVIIFCTIGFLVSVGLLRALWRRYFAEAGVVVVAACAVALGLATGLPVLLAQSDVYEVPISCGYMLTMLALGAIWRALHEPERNWRWLAAASMAYGLAVGARPTLLFGAIILLVPVAQARRQPRRIAVLLLAAIIPIMLIGLGLMLYNFLRFDNPSEFGMRYQLGPARQVTSQYFNLRYLWFNFRVNFLEPARWSTRFPFVHDITAPSLPAGYGSLQTTFGALTNIPLVWLALAVPLAWRSQSGSAAVILRWFVTAVALLFGMCALTLGLFSHAALRYEADFLPSLLLLAVIGILGLEHALADRPVRRRVARCGWGLLLGFSVAFNLLASLKYSAQAQNGLANKLFLAGEVSEAIEHYHQAQRLDPDYAAAHESLGNALALVGRLPEAIVQYEQALRIDPDQFGVLDELGLALARLGRIPEAMGRWEQAIRIKPDDTSARYDLALALDQLGRVPEAIAQYQQVLRINPDDIETRNAIARLQAAHETGVTQ